VPNIDPSNPPIPPNTTPNPIFDLYGNPSTTTLLGYTTPPGSFTNPNPVRLKLGCGAPGTAHPANCVPPIPSPPLPPAPTGPPWWQYYPGDPVDFPAPTQAFPACTLTTAYEKSVAGCIQTPISCNSQVNIQTSPPYPTPVETADAVNCLTHAATGGGDKVYVGAPSPPFQFIAGDDNPVPGLAGNNVMVSDSLVTVPVFDSSGGVPSNPVQIVGFVQMFLSPTGTATPPTGHMRTTVINIAGCGAPSGATIQQPILGNGASPVTVRLISPSNP
jgi:hypothetical protein